MKQLEMHIKDLLIGCPPIKIVTEEEMEEFGEIMDVNRDLSYGQLEVSPEGKLTSLMIDIDAITENNDVSLDEYEELSIEDLKEMGQDFVDEFGQNNLQLTSFSEWGSDTFLMIFEAIDVKYQIPLPDSGVTLEMNRQGFIMSATLNQAYYQLKYPEVTITAEQALEIYSNRKMVELGAMQQDNTIRLMYYPKHQNEAVTLEGEITPLTNFSAEEPVKLNEILNVNQTYTEADLLGITADLTKSEEDQIVTYTSEDGRKLVMNHSDEAELIIESNLAFTEGQELSMEELKQRAIAFLEQKVGNITMKYVLEEVYEEEQEEEEDDELTEEEIELLKELSAEDEEEEEEADEFAFEPFITFSFHRRIHGIPLNEYNAHIDMGIYSGTVKDAMIPLLIAQKDEPIQLIVKVPLDQADEFYKDSIKMELARVPHEEEDFIVYELCYIVKEKEPFKRLERIDAQNGNIFYVDDLEYVEEAE